MTASGTGIEGFGSSMKVDGIEILVRFGKSNLGEVGGR
jgi:hypothetical protein